MTVSALMLPVVLVAGVPAPAAANAASGTCARGYRLERFSYVYRAYNPAARLMWTITWRKRWCCSWPRRRIGSVHAPVPEVRIRGIYASVWRADGIVARDAYYTDRDARGHRRRGHPRWGHVSWFRVRVDHCTAGWLVCDAHHLTVGTVSYMDGSKKVIYP